MKIRTLKANEIEVRVGSINEKGATLLLYKDARVDMNILDESGLKWKRSHELVNGNLFCTISVWDTDIAEWISRQDVGVESNTEKEKGQASDAFKRAGFNFGIGRELYTAPFTWINSDNYSGFISGKTPQGKDRWATYDKFSVETIGYNDSREINELVIKNNNTGKIVFTMSKSNSNPKTPQESSKTVNKGYQPSPKNPVTNRQREFITNLLRQLGAEGKDAITDYLYDNFGSVPENELQAHEVIDQLNAQVKEAKESGNEI